MKKPEYKNRGQSLYTRLNFIRKKSDHSLSNWGSGFYLNQYGNFVNIFSLEGHETVKTHTIFTYIFEGNIHEKTYYRTFSNRGLMLVASKFILFVEFNT